MKLKNLSNKDGAQVPYTSPEVKVVVINVQGILCQSGSNEGYINNEPDWFD